MKEGFARLFCTIVASSVFGPILVVYLHSNRPELFESAQVVAGLYQLEPAVGLLFVSAPLLVIAGLPAWWLIGRPCACLSGTAIHGWARSPSG